MTEVTGAVFEHAPCNFSVLCPPLIRHRRQKSVIIIFVKIRLRRTGKEICLSQLEEGKGGEEEGIWKKITQFTARTVVPWE